MSDAKQIASYLYMYEQKVFGYNHFKNYLPTIIIYYYVKYKIFKFKYFEVNTTVIKEIIVFSIITKI